MLEGGRKEGREWVSYSGRQTNRLDRQREGERGRGGQHGDIGREAGRQGGREGGRERADREGSVGNRPDWAVRWPLHRHAGATLYVSIAVIDSAESQVRVNRCDYIVTCRQRIKRVAVQ